MKHPIRIVDCQITEPQLAGDTSAEKTLPLEIDLAPDEAIAYISEFTTRTGTMGATLTRYARIWVIGEAL